ncbi:hypothetical protein ACW5X7_002644 [Morganella morganii]
MKVIGYWILGVCSLFIFISLMMWIGIKDEYDFARSFSTIITLSSIGSFGLVVGSILAGCGAIVCEIRSLRTGGVTEPANKYTTPGNFVGEDSGEAFSFKKWTASSFVIRGDAGLLFDDGAVTRFIDDMKKSRPEMTIQQLTEHYKNGIDSIINGLPDALKKEFATDFLKKTSY